MPRFIYDNEGTTDDGERREGVPGKGIGRVLCRCKDCGSTALDRKWDLSLNYIVIQDRLISDKDRLFLWPSILFCKVGKEMSLRSQILKGILEGCILSVISRRPVYGYELAETLKRYGLVVSEGSIYPALMRLSKEGLIQGTMRKSPSGPNRKYYTLTEKGTEVLISFKQDWRDVMRSVERLLQEEQRDE